MVVVADKVHFNGWYWAEFKLTRSELFVERSKKTPSVEKSKNDGIVTSIYRKLTFTGVYTTWDSFCARKYKINLVRNLVQLAHRICSDSKLDEEFATLKSVFRKDG